MAARRPWLDVPMLPTCLLLTVLSSFPVPPHAPRAPSVHPSARERSTSSVRVTLRDLKRELRERYPDRRRRAVRKLAELDVHEGWELVLEALEDEDPQVADEAQLCVTEWDDPRDVLLGKQGLGSRQEIVRLRVAESFGRREERVDGAALARRIDPRDPRVARMLLWSLERLASRGLLFEIDDGIVRRVAGCLRANLDPRLRADALAALAVLDPGRAREELEAALEDREPAVRCAALAVARQLVEEGEGTALVRALADEAVSVRSQAIVGLGIRADRSAVASLAGALEGERRPRIRHELVRTLQRLSGRKYRDDPRPWKLFASRLEAGWKSEASPDDDPDEVGVGRTAAFAGLPILADRVCFLIDFSGSLWHERADGHTPKEVVDRELRTALEALAEGTEFNVVPYTREPHPWRPRLVENRSKVVADALRYFERCRETGPGSFFEAARFALADERVDEIVVLTDGAPTGGEHWNLELLFALLLHENRHRRVVFDAVLVEASSGLLSQWQGFTEATGGRALGVSLEEGEAVLRAR